MYGQGKLWPVINFVRSFSITPRNAANHYDVLGITPKATQNDIKSAYYKLSKVYHPDISTDEASAKKFRAISEAYEVLGNVQLKKMYDKGLIVGGDNKSRVQYEPEPEPTDPTLKFYKSRTKRQVVPTMDGRTPIYDFDSWSKNHYGSLFEKSKLDKEFIKKRQVKINEREQASKQEAFFYAIFLIGSIFTFLVFKGTSDYDQDVIEKNNQNKTKSNLISEKNS